MTSIFHSVLVKDFTIDSDNYNVIIQIKEDQDIKESRAHSSVLKACSPYFKNLLSDDMIPNENHVIIFNKSQIILK